MLPNKKHVPYVFLLPLSLWLFACAQNLATGDVYTLSQKLDTGCQITSTSYDGYYIGTNTCLSNDAFKSELQRRLRRHRVLRYTNNSGTYPAYFTKAFISLSNPGYEIPDRFDVWDAYVVFATKDANPYKQGANCPVGKLLDWYDYRCYDTPTEIISVSSGGQQDPGSADTLAAPTANFGNEGLYNREHSWPKNWFDAGATPVNNPAGGSYCYNGNNEGSWGTNWDYRAYTDLHHLIPARKSINETRGTCPFGIVQTPDTHFPRTNGAKFGSPDTSAMPGYSFSAIPGCTSDKVLEPAAELKGDIARNYFYMATRYYTEDTCWQTNYAVTRANLNPWLENLLRQWHNADPVSDEERARNNWIFRIQGNRNPFVDFPEWVDKIGDF